MKMNKNKRKICLFLCLIMLCNALYFKELRTSASGISDLNNVGIELNEEDNGDF